MSAGYQFGSLVAVESPVARQAVQQYAEKLFADQLRIWTRNREQHEPNKARHPTRAECLAKSIQIRVKRERDSRYWNDLVSRNPIH